MDIDIETLIPHRDRMRFLDAVIAVDAEKAVTAATVTEDWPLYSEGSVDVLVTIELVAQTAALLEGWKRLQSNQGGGYRLAGRDQERRFPASPAYRSDYSDHRGDKELRAGRLCRIHRDGQQRIGDSGRNADPGLPPGGDQLKRQSGRRLRTGNRFPIRQSTRSFRFMIL
jgi:hypothetical protein